MFDGPDEPDDHFCETLMVLSTQYRMLNDTVDAIERTQKIIDRGSN